MQLTQTLATLIGATSQATQAETGHGVTWQLLFIHVAQFHCIHLRRTERVVAQNLAGILAVYQLMNCSYAFAALLDDKAMQIIV
jgi:hypothetical protein